MAENQRKVNLEQIKQEITNKYIAIINNPVQRRRSADEKALGKSVHALLIGDGRASSKTKSERLSLNTYNRYLTQIRMHIESLGYTNHRFELDVKRAIKAYPNGKDFFNSLLGKDLKTVLKMISDYKKLHRDTKPENRTALMKGIRKELDNINARPEILKGMSMNGLLREDFRDNQAKSLEINQVKPIKVNIEELRDLTLELLTTPSDSANYAQKLALGISLATGRRAIETCVVGKFWKNGKSLTSIKFSGVAKDKNNKGDVIIPCLADPQLVIDAVENLRCTEYMQSIVEYMNSKIDSTDGYNRAFNDKSRLLTNVASKIFEIKFGKKPDSVIDRNGEKEVYSRNWIFKDSRALYANRAFIEYKLQMNARGEIGFNSDMFFTDVLAHSDAKARDNYKVFEIVDAHVKKIKSDLKPVILGRKTRVISTVESISDANDRIERIEAFKDNKKLKRNADYKTFIKVMDKMLELLRANPSVEITKKWMRDDVKGARTLKLNALFEILDKNRII